MALRILGLFVLLALCSVARAQSDFVVPVNSATTGRGIAGAFVRLTCLSGGCGSGTYSQTTDTSGNAQFTGVIAGKYTVTISGQQITSYSYTRDVTAANPSNLNNIIFVDGVTYSLSPDACVGANAAYAALPSTGGTIIFKSGNWNCTTPLLFNTLAKPVKLDLNGSILNFTVTGGTSATITQLSESTNTVTALSTLNPGANNFVAVTGSGGVTDGYTGVFQVIASNGSQFTYTNPISGLGSETSISGKAQLIGAAQTMVTLDWAAGSGGSYPWAGIVNGELLDNQCGTIGGCGYGTIGILNGSANGGTGQGFQFTNLQVVGFGAGEVDGPNTTWSGDHINDWYRYNTTGYLNTAGTEGENWQGGSFEHNGWGANVNTISVAAFNATHFDSNQILAIGESGSGKVDLTDDWFENFSSSGCGGYATHYFFGVNVSVTGGGLQDDCTSSTTDYFFRVSGQAQVFGLGLASAGRTSTQPMVWNGSSSEVHMFDNTAAVFTATELCNSFMPGICSVTQNGAYNSYVSTPPLFSGGGTQAISGCSLSSNLGGQWSGKFTSGTSGTCTVTVTFTGLYGQNGSWCQGTDITTGAALPETVSAIGACTFAGTTVSGNTVTWTAGAY